MTIRNEITRQSATRTSLPKTARRLCTPLILAATLLIQNVVIAAPSGSDLLEACTQSMRDGFDSMKGKLCTWYVTPCDCNIDKTIPMVCLPESVSTETLAGLVISGLQQRPDLQLLDATRAAAEILSARYSCPAAQ
jgi:Rap1a immunity proteins